MRITNRLAAPRADFLFLIVRRPENWRPLSPADMPPPGCAVLSLDYVASFEEAIEDLLRCNQLSMRHKLDKWAVVHSAGGDL